MVGKGKTEELRDYPEMTLLCLSFLTSFFWGVSEEMGKCFVVAIANPESLTVRVLRRVPNSTASLMR